jgi:hypothetical protein
MEGLYDFSRVNCVLRLFVSLSWHPAGIGRDLFRLNIWPASKSFFYITEISTSSSLTLFRDFFLAAFWNMALRKSPLVNHPFKWALLLSWIPPYNLKFCLLAFIQQCCKSIHIHAPKSLHNQSFDFSIFLYLAKLIAEIMGRITIPSLDNMESLFLKKPLIEEKL